MSLALSKSGRLSLRMACAALAACNLGSVVAPVVGQHFDVFPSRSASGTQTYYGGIDVDLGQVEPLQRVFESKLGKDPFDGTFVSDEPGFNHPADDAVLPIGAASLNGGDEIFVTAAPLAVNGAPASLFFWNGLGDVALAPASGPSLAIFTDNASGRSAPRGLEEGSTGIPCSCSATATLIRSPFPRPGSM